MLLQHFGYVVHSFKWNIVRVPLGVRVKEIPQYVVTLSSIKWINNTQCSGLHSYTSLRKRY